MSYPVWIKNSEGKYRLNPIGDKIKLLRKLPNGNWGCSMRDRVLGYSSDLEELLGGRKGLSKFFTYTSGPRGNGTYELRLD